MLALVGDRRTPRREFGRGLLELQHLPEPDRPTFVAEHRRPRRRLPPVHAAVRSTTRSASTSSRLAISTRGPVEFVRAHPAPARPPARRHPFAEGRVLHRGAARRSRRSAVRGSAGSCSTSPTKKRHGSGFAAPRAPHALAEPRPRALRASRLRRYASARGSQVRALHGHPRSRAHGEVARLTAGTRYTQWLGPVLGEQQHVLAHRLRALHLERAREPAASTWSSSHGSTPWPTP